MYTWTDFFSFHRLKQNNCWWFRKGKSIKTFHFLVVAAHERLLGCLLVHVSWSVTWSGVAGQPFYKMELSESVQRGLRLLAEPSVFERTSFQVLVDVSFRSLLSSHGDPSVLGELRSPARRRLCLFRYFRCFPVWISKRAACLRVYVCKGAQCNTSEAVFCAFE